MKILNAIAMICVILYVADHFARDAYLVYKTKMYEQELRSERLRNELRQRGLLN